MVSLIEKSAKECLNEAIQYCEKKDFYNALRKVGIIIQSNQDNPDFESYFIRGNCYLGIKKYELAIADYTKAIEINQDYFPAYSGRALSYERKEDYEFAVVDYSKMIELSPNNFEIYRSRGNCYFKLEKYKLALNDFNFFIKSSDSDNTDILSSRTLCYSKLNKHEIAFFDYNETVELNLIYDDENYNNGVLHYQRKEYDLALSYFTKSIQMNKKSTNYAEAYRKRGNCYFRLGEGQIGIKDFNKVIDLIISNFDFYNVALDKDSSFLGKIDAYIKFCDFREDKEKFFSIAINYCETEKKYDKARFYIKKLFNKNNDSIELHKTSYLKRINASEKLDETNKKLELQFEETKKANKIAHEKEKEMLSFFTHTMRNALATAPESLRQAIRLLGSEDYEKNKKQYKAINKIAALFSTLSLTDCLIDTFKQSINDPQEFKLTWQNDNTGDATPKWVIASALRQSLNRIIFMSDASQLEKLLNDTETSAIVSTRKSFIETVLPLNVDNQGINAFYDWLNGINSIEIAIEETNCSNFGVNQVKFSLLFAITSELILNALKYWNGTGHIQISWQLIEENFVFTVKNPCHANASSNLAGTHKGIAFINRLMELLGDQAHFNCIPDEQHFTAQLTLHKSLLGNNS